MARRTTMHVTGALTSLLPHRRIRTLARGLGVIQRQRKLDVVPLVYSLVLGFGSGDERNLTGLRRAYFKSTGVRLAPSSFHARFTESLAELMRVLLTEALKRATASRAKVHHLFAPFIEVLAVDSALVRLHDALAQHYPSVWTNHTKASAKLTVVMNVLGRGPKTVGLTHGSHSDVHLLKAGRWMRGRLILFDLGFFRMALFRAIEAYGGFFLTRARKNQNPVIRKSHRRKHRHLVGLKLKDALELVVQDEPVDFEAEMVCQSRSDMRHLVSNPDNTFRFVGDYNHHSASWHIYVTNIPTKILSAKHLAPVYAARWEVELLFRELKSTLRLDDMPSANKHASEALIYAAFLALLLSRRLYRALMRRWKKSSERHPFDRWTRLFATLAPDLLNAVLVPRTRRLTEARIEQFLKLEAMDPNARRKPLAFRAQEGEMAWA